MALLDLTGELTGMLPGLSPILAQTYINRSLTGIYGERLWSFLLTDGVVVCPTMIDDGTAAITQYSASVTLDATASAAIAAQLGVSAVPGLRYCQIRFSAASPAASQIYSITDYDDTAPAAVILTLDRVVQEATDAASSLQIFRNLVTPPIPDFLRWESFTDFANALVIAGNQLTLSSTLFDTRDPQRTANGLAYYLGAWGGNRISDPVTGSTIPASQLDAGAPIFELWPVPTSGQTWYVRLRRRGESLVNPSDVQPDGISDDLIIQRALYKHAYPFAQANVANFPQFKNANWQLLVQNARTFYREELSEAKRTDQEKSLQSSDNWNRGHGLRTRVPFGRYNADAYPIDANFIQSHLVRF